MPNLEEKVDLIVKRVRTCEAMLFALCGRAGIQPEEVAAIAASLKKDEEKG